VKDAAKIDPREFRNALGSFVTGVTIVTTLDETGQPVGLTANSFNSVSLDPPLVLWSLGLNSGSLSAFRNAPYWAVHILAADQQDLSGRFAQRGVDKFAGLDTETGPGGIPLLRDCAARFVCRTAFEYEGGDHAIFVGAVESFTSVPAVPLAYHEGRYARVLTAAPTADIIARAAAEGVSMGEDSIAGLLINGLLEQVEGGYCLTAAGRQTLVELAAVAHVSEERAGGQLAPNELALLRDILARLSGVHA